MKQPPLEVPLAHGLRVAIVRARFNAPVVDGLLAGAQAALAEMGAEPERLALVEVPGAFELPLAARAAADSGRFDAVVALGAVIRGETDHYEHIAREAASGLSQAALVTGVPIGFGVLTVGQEGQAQARSRPGPGNKGAEAARAAVAMVHVLRGLRPATGGRAGRKTVKRRGHRSSPGSAPRAGRR